MEALQGTHNIIWVVDDSENTESVAAPTTALSVVPSRETFFWTTNNTKILIDLYKTYKSKVGTMELKNFKTMWEKISKEISEILNTHVSTKNVDNRWKVLDRNFKKHIDNKNSTGRGRKYFEFEAEMEDACGHKKNLRPEILLGTEKHIPLGFTQEGVEKSKGTESDHTHENVTKSTPRKTIGVKKSRKTVLQAIREDRLKYQENTLRMIQEALQEQMKLLQEMRKMRKKKK